MTREEIVAIDHPSEVMLDTTTIPGLYLISPQRGQRDETPPHPSHSDVLMYDAKGKWYPRPQDPEKRAY
jgi:hypothetical protein